MTGYARCEGRVGGCDWTWEVRSVNARRLDVRCRLPLGLEEIEPLVRGAVQEGFRRGNLTLTLTLTRPPGGVRLRLNEEAVEQLAAIIEALAKRIDAAAPRIEGLLRVPGVVETVEIGEAEEERERHRSAVLAGLDEALGLLAAMRAKEGARLEDVLHGFVDELARLHEAAAASAAAQPAALKASLKAQVAELLEEFPPLPEERLAQEVAVLATKSDVREELDRLKAHIEGAREILAAGGAVGRKLDFLCQELNREANTVCSKSADLELTRIGLELKATVEQFREQVQNIE